MVNAMRGRISEKRRGRLSIKVQPTDPAQTAAQLLLLYSHQKRRYKNGRMIRLLISQSIRSFIFSCSRSPRRWRIVLSANPVSALNRSMHPGSRPVRHAMCAGNAQVYSSQMAHTVSCSWRRCSPSSGYTSAIRAYVLSRFRRAK